MLQLKKLGYGDCAACIAVPDPTSGRSAKTARWYHECGPFSLIDSFTNRIVDKGLTLHELERSATNV